MPAIRSFDIPALHLASSPLQFAFFPFAAMAAVGLLRSTRGKSFGPQFWLEATLVALCVGTVLWLAMPHDLAPDSLPARGSWTLGLDAVIGVLAAILLLRRSDWQGWPGLVAFALALGSLLGARLLEALAATAGGVSLFAGPLHISAIAAFAIAAHFDYLRTERRAPPIDAAERGSPFAPLMPYAALLPELEHSVHMKRRRTMADTLPQGARFTARGRFVMGDLRPADFVASGTFGRELN
jgi:hypothetical protein